LFKTCYSQKYIISLVKHIYIYILNQLSIIFEHLFYLYVQFRLTVLYASKTLDFPLIFVLCPISLVKSNFGWKIDWNSTLFYPIFFSHSLIYRYILFRGVLCDSRRFLKNRCDQMRCFCSENEFVVRYGTKCRVQQSLSNTCRWSTLLKGNRQPPKEEYVRRGKDIMFETRTTRRHCTDIRLSPPAV